MPTVNPTICQVLHSLVVGGAEVLAARLARALAPQYRFVFACLDELGTLGEELRSEGFLVEVLRRRPGIDWRCMKALRRLWQREGVALVHAHQYTPFFYALAARHWRRLPPVLFTEHGRWFPDFRRPKRVLFNRLMLRRTDRVVGVGEAVRRALVNNEGIPSGRVQVIYNGVDGAAFNGQMVEPAAVRRELGLADDQLIVIHVARLDHLRHLHRPFEIKVIPTGRFGKIYSIFLFRSICVMCQGIDVVILIVNKLPYRKPFKIIFLSMGPVL